MPQFITKDGYILEAMKWNGNCDEIMEFIKGNPVPHKAYRFGGESGGEFNFTNRHGTVVAYHGDYVIKRVKGEYTEFFPCDGSIFETLLQPV